MPDGARGFSGKPLRTANAPASTKYGIPIGILYAVGLTEIGHEDSLQPYALNVEGKAFFMRSVAAAVARFREAQSQGAKLVDLGCMQINYHFHANKFPSLSAMLDPATNVDYAARFLKELKAREGAGRWLLLATTRVAIITLRKRSMFAG
jgi:hypothetical protein